MRIIVHGGMHKTGTKSLQRAMAASRADLLRAGVVYPETSGDTHGILLDSRAGNWNRAACRQVVRNAEAAGAEVLFLSSETVSLLSERQFARLQSCFTGHQVRYVFCLRDWSDFLPSRWVQNSMRRDTQTFEAYVAAVEAPEPPHIDLRYDLVLERAVNGTGAEVAAVSMPAARASSDGVVGTILRAAGLDDRAIAIALAGEERRANERPPWQVSELCRLLNGIVANKLGLPQDDLCRSIAESRLCETYFDFASWLPERSPRLWARLIAAVETHGTEIRFARPAAAGQVIARLDKFRPLFFNLSSSQASAVQTISTVTLAAIEWKQFAAGNADVIQMLLQNIGFS